MPGILNYWGVQVAVFERLNSAEAAADITWPVSDQAAQNQEPPYIVIGDIDTDLPNDTNDGAGWSEQTFLIHLWSKEFSSKPLKEMMANADKWLNKFKPAADSSVLIFHRVSALTMQDQDGETRHGVLRYRVLAKLSAGE
jgi:hypothetical protein